VRVHTLATALHGAERVQLHQVRSDDTLGTSDVATHVDALRALAGVLLRHDLATGLATVERQPALRRAPEVAILGTVLGRALLLRARGGLVLHFTDDSPRVRVRRYKSGRVCVEHGSHLGIAVLE